MTKTIAIIGLGYVGLPLAIEFGKKYPTLGFDINPTRIQELQAQYDRTYQIDSVDFHTSVFLSFHNDLEALKNAQTYIITVPTPLDNYKNPDISYLLNASKMIAPLLKPQDIVIYESTTYPTCTLKDCVPILEQYSSLKFNQDFFVGYSPERINPGDREHKLPEIQKITSGSTPKIAQEIDALYSSIITAGTYLAPSIEVAEMAKVIENAQRDLNIAFVNEIALICDKLGIETQEVLKAASTKWNFLPFKPGLVGGHCISIDPYYLTHKAHELGYHPRVISAGRLVNDAMPNFIAQKLIKLLIAKNIKILGAKVLILGVTFKENCNDIRNSKVFEVIDELVDYGCEITLLDPLAIPEEVAKLTSAPLYSNLKEIQGKFDGILASVAHKEFSGINLTSHTYSYSVVYDLKGMLESAHSRL